MSGYFLFPSVSGKKIVFTSDDDLWSADLDGKNVSSVVENIGTISHPAFSPDGKKIAFRVSRGTAEPVSEIYVCDSSGEGLKRVTYIGSPVTDLAGWHGNDSVVVISDEGSPFMRETFLFEVDLRTMEKKPIEVGPASGILFSDSGTFVLRGLQDLTFWKGYRGGTRGKLWFDSGDKGKYSKFLELETGVYSPVYLGGRVYFITDLDGRGNVYSVDLKGKDMKQHTKFKEYYARNLSTDGKTLVFHMGGEIYSLKPGTSKPEKIDLKVPLKASRKQRRFIDPSKFLEEFSISYDGKKAGFVVRGKGFSFDPRLQKATNLDPGSKFRMRNLVLSKNGRKFFLSDDGGTEKLYFLEEGQKKKMIHESDALLEKMFPSPDGNMIAVSTNRFELIIVDVKTGKSKKILESEFGMITDVAWHPSEKWIAVSLPEAGESSRIYIADSRTGKKARVTSFGFNDYGPAFDPLGHYLYYFSDRNLDPVYDKITFDLGFPKVTLPVAVTLLATEKPPMLERGDENASEEKKVKPNDKVDLEGIDRRSVQVPVQAFDYSALYPTEDALYLMRYPTEGALKFPFMSVNSRQDGELVRFDFGNGKEKRFLKNITDAKMSGNCKFFIVRTGNAFRLERVTKHISEFKLESDSDQAVKIDLSKLKVSVDPGEEWNQMLLETWRLMREKYWRESKIAPRWNSIRDRYLKLIPKVSSRFEASDVLKEMQGETGTSHSYERGGELLRGSFHPVGKLGAEVEKKGKSYVIKKILAADASLESERSPLLAPGVDIREGDEIVSVNGIPLSDGMGLGQILENLADDHVDLKVRRNGKESDHDITTLKSETSLRYREWVENNRNYVHEKSKGKVGYIHIPDMMARGFAEFFRLYRSEWDHDSLIVDVRFNGGGHVSHLLLEKLARQLIGYDIPRRGKPSHYPNYAIRGGIIAITNEYAGSDGDIFSHSFKLLGLGPLIGTRTWGGVVGINPRRHLVDGTFVTQPEFSFWFRDVGFGVENYGTDPTIELDITPDEYGKGKDPQLDRAISEALKTVPKDSEPYNTHPEGESRGKSRKK